MRPITVTVGPLGNATANSIALSQSPTVGNLTLNGSTVVNGVAVLDKPRQVLITTAAGSEAANTFTLVGTDPAGSPISETITGPIANSTAGSVLSYATVSQIAISGNATGNLSVGTSGIASSAWVRLDEWANSYVAVQCNLSGAGNYTLQQTLDDPNSPTNPVSPANVTWANSSDTVAVGASTSIQTNYGFAPTFARVLLNSGNGTVSATFVQYDVVSR